MGDERIGDTREAGEEAGELDVDEDETDDDSDGGLEQCS